MNPELSLIIPAYNESQIIVANVDELSSWMKSNMGKTTYEIIVVNDGSTDGMGELLTEACADRTWLRVVHHERNKGRGRGIRTGFENCVGEYIVCLDADLSYDPSVIKDLTVPLLKGDADITLASAHHPEGKMVNVPEQRAMLSRWGNRVLGVGFESSYYTVTCVVRGFKRNVVKSLELVNDGKELHLEIIQKAELMGFNIVEIPAVLEWRDKERGSKKTGFLPEIAIIKMRKTVVSHLIFNFISRPGILLLFPMLTFLMVMITTFFMLLISFFSKIAHEDSIFQALRQTLIDGQLSLSVFFVSFFSLMFFTMFYFLSNQSKKYFDEIYVLNMRMNIRLKKLEEKQ